MNKAIAETVGYIIYGTYMVAQFVLSIVLGLYLIVYNGLELLDWVKGGELSQFPVAAALHIGAGLLLFKLANYMRQWPMIRAYTQAMGRMVNSQ